MKYIEQKIKKEKEPSSFRPSDFVPGIGLRNYEARNPPDFREKYPPGFLRNIKALLYEGVKTHKNILEVYNFTIGLIADGLIYYHIVKPIGDWIIENIFK